MLIDSHCHLDRIDLAPYDGNFDALVSASVASGVARMLCVSIDLESFQKMMDLIADYDEISASVGVHPHDISSQEPTVEQLLELARHPKIVAIGETGLDYYYAEGDLEWQRSRFRTHIQAAIQCAKPLIVHTRDAREDTIRVLTEEHAERAGGVMHCFTENWGMAEAAIDLGFYISFSGIITFKNADSLREVAKKVPLDRILVETDSPYLAPVPFRGKPNEPKLVTHVAQTIAELRGLDYDKTCEITAQNYYRLFGKNNGAGN
jgi:TatD DNase family protein